MRKVSIVIAVIALFHVSSICAQTPAQDPLFERQNARKEPPPIGLSEMMTKMRIAQEKKEHAELVKRGEEALRLSEQLEKSFAQSGSIGKADREKLEDLEKLVKKIRSEMGGGADGKDDDAEASEKKPADLVEGFKVLQSTTVKLFDEIKKTSRFSISAVAIQNSNTLLKVVRFLRSANN